MTAVFADTVGMLALWDGSDQWHVPAATAFAAIRAARMRLVTTTFVLLECGNAAARRPYRKQVDAARVQFASRKALIVPSDEDWSRAWAAFSQNQPPGAGIVDCISFEVMRRHGMTMAFTNDQHFQNAGFRTLF